MSNNIFYQCGSCGYCLDACSVYVNTFAESVSPRGKLLLLKKFSEGILENPSPITERMYTCTLCGKCEDACPSTTAITSVIQDWRNTHPYTQNSVRSSVKSVFEKGNPYDRPQSEREKWHTGYTTDSSTAYFPGCTTSLMQPHIAESFIQIMKERLPFQIIDNICCGSLLSKTGFQQESEDIIEKNIQYFKEKGVKTLITSCAGCYSFFLEYPFNIKVMHTSEILDDYLHEFNPGNICTTYHDPCHLLRTHITAQPRHLLKTLSDYTEKESHICCGAGGGMLLNFRELADSMCKNLLKELTPSRHLVTACPFCLYHMKRNTFYKIWSLEEFVASCINE